MTKRLGTIPLPETEARAREDATLGSELVQSGLLESDAVDVEALSSQAADITLEGTILPSQIAYPEIVGTELQELGSATTEGVPLFRVADGTTGTRWQKSGYYDVESEDVARVHTAIDGVWEYRLSLTRSGTRGGHFRAVYLNERTVTHPFGSGTSSTVAVPSTASKLRWYDRDTGETDPVDGPTSTTASSVGDIDIYDIPNSPDRLALLYDVDYETDATVGVRSYDTRGTTSKFDDDGTRHWQTIHETQHDIDSETVLSNGILRIRVDETQTGDAGLDAQEYDSVAGEWTDLSLSQGTAEVGTWDVLDLDLIQIGQHRELAQLTFRNDGQRVDQDVNIALAVGDNDALVFDPPGVTSGLADYPDLQDWLSPIAQATTIDPQASRGLISREEVRS